MTIIEKKHINSQCRELGFISMIWSETESETKEATLKRSTRSSNLRKITELRQLEFKDVCFVRQNLVYYNLSFYIGTFLVDNEPLLVCQVIC